jgi:hypothetical protein
MYFDFMSMRASQRAWLVCMLFSLLLLAGLSSSLFLAPARSAFPADPIALPNRKDMNVLPAARLPQFDPAVLVGSIHRAGRDTGVAVGPVDLALEQSAERSYSRYRAKFQVSGSYRAFKEFVFAENAASAVRWIDHIHCVRDAADFGKVRCDLALSAFYERIADGAQ